MRNLCFLICLALFLPNLFAQRRIETTSYNPDALSLYQKALEQREGKNVEGAIQSLREALQADPTYVDALDQLAFLHYEQNLLDSAIHYYRRSVNRIPRHLFSHQRLALIYKQQQEFKAALVQYDLILRTFADNPVIQAETYMSMCQIYEHGLRLENGSSDWNGLRGSAEEAMRLYLMGGQSQKAAKARMAAAKAYFHMETYNIALRYLKENKKIMAENAELNYYLGATYLKMRKLEKANTYLSRAIEQGYEVPRDLMQEWRDSY